MTVDFETKTAAVSTPLDLEAARGLCDQALRDAGYGVERFAETDAPPPTPA